MTEKHPWLKWYPADWRSDTALRACSVAARGLWIDLIGLMHEAEPYGHLLIGGCSPTHTEIGRLVGIHRNAVTPLVTELVTRGVASVSPGGVIFSRRMLRDHEKSLKNRENGHKGGNPVLLETVNQKVKAQNLEARIQKKESRKGGADAPTPQAKRSTFPPEFILTPALKKEAEAGGHREPDASFRRFRLHHEGHGTKSANWPVMWTSWWEGDVRRDRERRAERADPQRAPTIFVHYGDDGLPRYSSKQPADVTYGDDGLPRYSS